MRLEDEAASERVLVLAPTGRDAETIARVLEEAQLRAEQCADVDGLCTRMEEGAGAVLIAEEAFLVPGAAPKLAAVLRRQEAWSDLPIVLVTGSGELHEARLRAMRLLEPAGNVTILERPFRKLTLVTVFEATLRARRRQYAMRDATRALLRSEHLRANAEAMQRSEARYRAIARHYPNGVVLLVDRSLRCILAEGQGLSAFVATDRRLEGRPLGELFEGDVAARFDHGARLALAGEITTEELRRGDRTHLVHFVPFEDALTGVDAAMVVTQDITEQKRAEDELREEAAIRERFVGVLAHDLRTPLQAISFSAHWLATKDMPPQRVRSYTTRIASSADRMARMVSDLLDFTRSRHAGGIGVDPEQADLAAVVRSTVEEMQAATPGRRIVLTSRGDTKGVWDADRLAQVASNLIGNALSYSPPDTPISVDLRAEGDEVVFEVENGGDPIPPEMLAAIFDPFKRAVNGAAKSKMGLGLGLFIADRIVRAHGGTIAVSSAAEEGTHFTVRLPRRSVSTSERTPEASPGAGGTCPLGSADARRVLVVDDDDIIRDLLRDTLEDHGYRVLTARDGREALEVLREAEQHGEQPCVVLLDLMMPVMTGWQLLDAIEHDRTLPKVPVVVMSAAKPAREVAPGVKLWLPKPIEVNELLAAIDAQCAA